MSTIPVRDTPQALPEETVEQRVRRLLATWREQTGFLSSSTARVSHPAYRELIALGAAALPFVFRDMEQTLDGRSRAHWLRSLACSLCRPRKAARFRRLPNDGSPGRGKTGINMTLLEEMFPGLRLALPGSKPARPPIQLHRLGSER